MLLLSILNQAFISLKSFFILFFYLNGNNVIELGNGRLGELKVRPCRRSDVVRGEVPGGLIGTRVRTKIDAPRARERAAGVRIHPRIDFCTGEWEALWRSDLLRAPVFLRPVRLTVRTSGGEQRAPRAEGDAARHIAVGQPGGSRLACDAAGDVDIGHCGSSDGGERNEQRGRCETDLHWDYELSAAGAATRGKESDNV